MTQEDEWKEVEDTEFKKLEIGESITGVLLKVEPSTKYEAKSIYTIHEQGAADSIKIFGTTILDRKMEKVPLGSLVKIVREDNEPSDKGNPLQMYKVFWKQMNAGATPAQENKEKSVFGGN